MSTSAKIIKDSINSQGDRVTTFEVTFHRFVLAEFNTHRVLSRNSASSRAIPVSKQLAKVREDIAYPLSWPAEQRGMQGGEEFDEATIEKLKDDWKWVAKQSCFTVEALVESGLHKSVVNRLLEPFMWHTAIVTGTAWQNFFDQRCSPLAQPEIRAVADLMHEAYIGSEPEHLGPTEWHLPYIDNEDREWAAYKDPDRVIGGSAFTTLVKISAARCARVSYLTQEGKRDPVEDLRLYARLTEANPKHWSPLEHVATPMLHNRQEGVLHLPSLGGSKYNIVSLSTRPKHGNLLGWASLRSIVEAELGEETYR